MFEFQVENNLLAREGTVEGYFAVGAGDKSPISPISQAYYRSPKDQGVIPIVTDEFAYGLSFRDHLPTFSDKLRAIATFGTEEYRTHLDIISREIGLEQSGLLAVKLQLPDGMKNSSWKYRSGLEKINLKFGSLTLEGSVCKIEVDESVECLTRDYDDLDDDDLDYLED